MFRMSVPAACTAVAVLLLLAPVPLAAQSNNELLNRLNRLQSQVIDLERAVFAGTPPARPPTAPGAAPGPAATPELLLRVQQLENQLKELVGQLDTLRFENEKLGERISELAARLDASPQAAQVPPAPATATVPRPAPQAGISGVPGSTGSDSGTGTGTLGQLDQDDIADGTPSGTQDQNLDVDIAAARYNHAFSLVVSHDYPRAERAFQTFLQEHSDHPLAGTATYWLGETYYVRGDYRQAAITFANGFRDYSENPKAPDNLLKLALSLARLDRQQDACVALDELGARFPNASRVITRGADGERKRLACDG
ncbi:MAG: tol-pal system protein YbgF [Alphaproteobacteria bacterium]|nr:tol-pal system protein YbgF [Alphaproteobacteria bacterium]